jgi:hypothetical protein
MPRATSRGREDCRYGACVDSGARRRGNQTGRENSGAPERLSQTSFAPHKKNISSNIPNRRQRDETFRTLGAKKAPARRRGLQEHMSVAPV